jgi:hypothetical protein
MDPLRMFRPGARPFLLAVLAACCIAAHGWSWAASPSLAGDGLKPGAFVWLPQLAPTGPMAIVVSLPAQRAYVYRNGVRIGVSTVSTGRPGHDTPTGIYTILEKRREHYSNLYDNAPMPFMQRLSWDGIALHAGALPGYPASHGCVRLPASFAETLFAATKRGTIVVVAAEEAFPPGVVSPGMFSPVDAGTGKPATPLAARDAQWEWAPERSGEGPVSVLVSLGDRRVVVLRNAVEIGRSALHVEGPPIEGSQAFVLLEGTLPRSSLALPDRPALRWMSLALPGEAHAPDALQRAFAERRLAIPRDFARLVYDALQPGATVLVTDQPLAPGAGDVTVLASDAPPDRIDQGRPPSSDGTRPPH